MMGGVGGVRKSIHQSWLAKGLGLGLGSLFWGFKEVQKRFRRKRPALFNRVTLWRLLIPSAPRLSLWDIEEMEEAVTKVIDTLTQEDYHGAFQKLLERYNKSIAAGGDYFEGD